MASACIPFLFRTVEIDGEPYWSGGFVGNPTLEPLVKQAKSKDVVVVQTTAIKSEDVPTNVQDIVDRVTEISFNTALKLEQRLLEASSNSKFHCIEAEDILGSLGRSSKFNADWNFLEHLRDTGRQAAEDWIMAIRKQETKAESEGNISKFPLQSSKL